MLGHIHAGDPREFKHFRRKRAGQLDHIRRPATGQYFDGLTNLIRVTDGLTERRVHIGK